MARVSFRRLAHAVFPQPCGRGGNTDSRYCLLHSVFWNRCAPHVSGDCHIRSVVSFAILLIACSMTASTTMSFFMCVAGGLTLGLARVQIRYGKKHGLDISPLLVIPAYWAFGFGALISAAFMIAFSSRRALQNMGGQEPVALCVVRGCFCRRHAGCAMWLLCLALCKGFALSRNIRAVLS